MGFLAILLYFGVPIGAIAFFASNLDKYLQARKNNAEPAEIKKCKLLLFISAAIALLLVAAVVAVGVLLMMSIAYM